MLHVHKNLLSLVFAPGVLLGQTSSTDLEIFGYFQSTFDHSREQTSIMEMPAQITNRNTFILQQANVFFRKQFDPHFSSFLNIEFTNSYSSSRGWGSIRVEEAWVRYEPAEYLSIKAGLLVPVFNNLNEIKNRMPLLPYITRPIVYEAAAEGNVSLDEFIPEAAFVQVAGALSLNQAKVDYALYAGNGDPSFTKGAEAGSEYLIGGVDTTTFKLFGGRVGARAGRLKAGFSMTADWANRVALGFGGVRRLRFGGDFSAAVGPLSFEAEIISTKELLDDSQLMIYQMMARMDFRLGSKPNNFFAYGVATFDINDDFYAYAGIEYLEYHGNSLTRGYMVGGGMRPVEPVVVKLQYLHLENDFRGLSTYQSDRLQAGVSVIF
jgi:hypothetical protein